MKRKTLVSALMAVVLASSQIAFAQGHGNHDNGGDRYDQGQRGGPPARHDNGRRPHEYRGDQRHANDFYGDRRDERGAGPNQDFRRGDRLPPEYRGRYYVVDDWRGHRLSQPPRGYHWIQTGGDYVLVAITTGIILQILLNH